MAIQPDGYWPAGAQGNPDDPFVIGYMNTVAWLYEIPATHTQLYASPRDLQMGQDYKLTECVEVEVRFRSLIEVEEIRQARSDNGPPLPEVVPLRETALESLRLALVILRDNLQERARHGSYGATGTLGHEVSFANSMLNGQSSFPNFHWLRAPLERAIDEMERGARHLDLPTDFWRAMLVAADNLGLFWKHFQYQKLLRALESAQNPTQ